MGELHNKRFQNILDACNLQEPEKVPIGIDVSGWAFHYAGKGVRHGKQELYACRSIRGGKNDESWEADAQMREFYLFMLAMNLTMA